MRFTRVFGLAMLAAVAAMAIGGVGSASAQLGSVLCHLGTPEAAPCPAGQLPYTGPILGTGLGKDTFVSGFTTVLCDGHMAGSVSSAGSATTDPLGTITSVTWTNCISDTNICALVFSSIKEVKAAASGLPWHVTLLGTATLSVGQMHISGVKGSFTILCKSGVSFTCVYGADSVLPESLNHTATTPTQIHANKLPLLRKEGSSGACSETGSWSGLYDLTQNLSVHLL